MKRSMVFGLAILLAAPFGVAQQQTAPEPKDKPVLEDLSPDSMAQYLKQKPKKPQTAAVSALQQPAAPAPETPQQPAPQTPAAPAPAPSVPNAPSAVAQPAPPPVNAGAPQQPEPPINATPRPQQVVHAVRLMSKYQVFTKKLVNPLSVVTPLLSAGWSHWTDKDNPFGRDGEAFGYHYGALLGDKNSGTLFKSLVLPVILRQQNNYTTKRDGSGGRRFFRAISQVIITQTDHGHPMLNFSELGGSYSSANLGNSYYPETAQDAQAVARRASLMVGTDAAFNVFTEFWPDVARKMHLPGFLIKLAGGN